MIAASKPRKKRRWLRRLALVGISAGVAVVALEVYLRQTMSAFRGPAFDLAMFEEDASGWTATIPGYEGNVTWAGRTTSVRLNELGMRGAPVPERRPGEKRILVVGDSVTFGVGVEVEDTFGYRLQALLSREPGRRVTVGIGAAPGYGTIDLERIVRRVKQRFEPDLILAGVFLGNDLEDNFQATRIAVDGYRLTGPPARIAKESFRMRMSMRFRTWFVVEDFLAKYVPTMSIKIPDMQPEIDAFRDFPAERAGAFFMDHVEVTPSMERILDKLEQGLQLVKAAAESTPVVVLILPTPTHCDEAVYRRMLDRNGWALADYRRGALQQRIIERCQQLDLEVLDLTAELESLDHVADAFLPQDAHLDVRGHTVVAEYLAEELAKRGW